MFSSISLFGGIPFILLVEHLGLEGPVPVPVPVVVPILLRVEMDFLAGECINSGNPEDADCDVAGPLALASGRDAVELKLQDQPRLE